MGKIIATPEARLSFPSLFQPAPGMNGGEAKYSATLLFPKTADLSALREAAEAAAKEKWGAKRPKNLRMPFRDGDEKELDGYKGTIFIRAASAKKPVVVGEDLQPILDAAAIYPGCYVRAALSVYAYDKAGNAGISFGLLQVKKERDGEPFGASAASPESVFGQKF